MIFTLNTPPKNPWIIQDFFHLAPAPQAPGFYISKIKKGSNAIYIPGTFRNSIDNIDLRPPRDGAQTEEP